MKEARHLGLPVPAGEEPSSCGLTVSKLIDWWVDEIDGLSSIAASGVSNRRSHLAWWKKAFGPTPYTDLSTATIQDALRVRYTTPNTRNRVRATLGRVIRDAICEGKVCEDKLKGLYEKESAPRSDEPYTDDELRRLFASLEEEDDKRLLVMYALALTTGARHAALWDLRVSDFDFEKGLVTLTRKVKRGQHRAIPLQPWVEKLVLTYVWPLRYSATEMPLFKRSDYKGKTWPRTVNERVLERAAIKRKHPFHTMRHTFVTRAIVEGVPTDWVARFSGHTTLHIMSRYKHLTDSSMEQVFSRKRGEDHRTEAQRLADATRDPLPNAPAPRKE